MAALAQPRPSLGQTPMAGPRHESQSLSIFSLTQTDAAAQAVPELSGSQTNEVPASPVSLVAESVS